MGKYADRPEEALRVLYKAGDQEAFHELWTRYEKVFIRLSDAICQRQVLAEQARDRAQDKLQSPKARTQYDAAQPWPRWARRILIRECLSVRRKKNPVDSAFTMEPVKGGEDTDPAEGAMVREVKTAVKQCLAGLPSDHQRKVLVERHFQGRKLREIAEAWYGDGSQSRISQVYRIYQDAVKHMKQCLTGKGFPGGMP